MAIDVSRRFRERLPDVAEVATRFPFAVLAAAAFTAYFLFDFHRSQDWGQGFAAARVPLGLVSVFLWALGAALFAEARRFDRRSNLSLSAAGVAVIAVLFGLMQGIELFPLALIAALGLGSGLAAYTGAAPRNAAVWRFNHDLAVGGLAAALTILLFIGGLLAIIETLRYLFGLNIPYRAYEKLWVITCGLVGPIYGLSLVPRDLDAEVPEGPPSEFTSRAIAVLVKFILAPLLLVYAAILHVYAVKILIDFSLPKGRLGYLVLSYGVVLAATALATFPTRESGGTLVRLFWRIWPWMLVVPIGLLFLAVAERIRQYGLTEQRYLVVLAGIWLTSLVATQGLTGARRDLRLVPGVLAILLALASIGPWGMEGWPVRNQVRELAARLTAAGIIKDGRVTADARPTTALLTSDKQRLHGIIDYLRSRGRLEALRPYFAGAANDPFAGVPPAETTRHSAVAEAIRGRLGLGRNLPGHAQRWFNYHGNKAASIPVADRHHLIGPLSIGLNARSPLNEVVIATPQGELKFAFDAGILNVRDQAAQRSLRFDVGGLGRVGGALLNDAIGATSAGIQRTPLVLKPLDQSGDASLILTSVSGTHGEKGEVEISHISGWLLLAPKP